MKIALITDTHWGVRNDSPIMHNHMKKFLDEIFFPTIDSRNITTIIHLGDLVDRRKYVNYVTAKRLRDDFLDPIHERGLELHIIAGNHDTYYKNTNNTNALVELIGDPKPYNDVVRDIKRYPKTYIYYEAPCELNFKDTSLTPGPTMGDITYSKLFLMPWICDENREATLKAIEETKAPIVLGHLELYGYEMYKGQVSEHGDDPKIFDKFDLVLSGHYHTRSSRGNIHYLGTPVQYIWSDYVDTKGFHILDTETRSIEFVPNPNQIFHKFFYDDLNKNMDEVLVFDADQYKDCYVKIVIKNKTNPYWFDLVIERLEKSGAADLQVVEDHFHLDLEADDDIVNEAEDTMSIIHKFIDGMNINIDRKRVENIIQNLYIEAHDVL
jgi:DNA repair exonuclease SbcCD nuclease subunit